ncbi:MAG: hypothetical protein J7521_04745 [Caulobacter sp.]|nr:hypothetical protein [Caulobacter sp.]
MTTIDDRFPAIFELRRLFYPRFEPLADPDLVDQGIGGFLDHVQKKNFVAFADQTQALTGQPVLQVERVTDDGVITRLDQALIADFDTIVVISFDSVRTRQIADPSEVAAVRGFLDHPDHVMFVCPHHDIGGLDGQVGDGLFERQRLEHAHHADGAIPPRQAFGQFARSLLEGLDVPVLNRFGLRPAVEPDGSPATILADRDQDRLGFLDGVGRFNLHPHLPHFERVGGGLAGMNVLARQPADLSAPAHPFLSQGHTAFDALLQSTTERFAGALLVCDATLFSSTVGGLDHLRRFWANIIERPAGALRP